MGVGGAGPRMPAPLMTDKAIKALRDKERRQRRQASRRGKSEQIEDPNVQNESEKIEDLVVQEEPRSSDTDSGSEMGDAEFGAIVRHVRSIDEREKSMVTQMTDNQDELQELIQELEIAKYRKDRPEAVERVLDEEPDQLQDAEFSDPDAYQDEFSDSSTYGFEDISPMSSDTDQGDYDEAGNQHLARVHQFRTDAGEQMRLLLRQYFPREGEFDKGDIEHIAKTVMLPIIYNMADSDEVQMGVAYGQFLRLMREWEATDFILE
jgi:hypothetical protein